MEYEDIIHGKIEIPDFIEKIIETPHFQRLKKVRQLGLYSLAFPEANHTRYDHCIGTYHLANKTIDFLENNTEDLRIPDFYRKAVGIAGLLHDVGHGPFSHTWETICSRKYLHEEMARDCIAEILKNVSIDWNDKSKEYAFNLINGLIEGDPSCLEDKEYLFLFEIVNNKQCDVDVDKWDYLKRDNVMMKASAVNMDFDDVFIYARATDDRAHIEYRYIDYPKIYNIFETRSTFHINHYERPKIVCLENILKHIIDNAHSLEQINSDTRRIDLLDVRSEDREAFLKLTDEEIWRILKVIQSPPEVVELVKALRSCSLTEIYPATEEQEAAVPQYLKVNIDVPFAGEKMKEGNILFYGNESDKPNIQKKMGNHQTVSYFAISNELLK